MRLQRLEINGFKSFSDRSELAFDDGVTAIVGPNGCGKSNVADAITWVMGEQSAKSLRGDKMEDLIFSGSDARKPTAAAEVKLKFSGFLKTVVAEAVASDSRRTPANGNGQRGNGNGHHSHNSAEAGRPTDLAEEIIQSVAREIEVTRRLYRSGESEYLIDGQLCRLKDIHDLLMDTGLGAKAYAIIEQGKIGMILSSRPTDRRQLIEEAAGVTKYKARRRASRKSRAISAVCGSSSSKRNRAPPPRAKRRTRGSCRSTAGSSRSRSIANRCRRSMLGPPQWRASSRRSNCGANRPGHRSCRAAKRRLRPTRNAIAPRRRMRRNRRRTRRRTARSRGSKRTSKRRAAKSSRQSTQRRHCGTRSIMRPWRARRSPRRWRSWTSRAATCASNRNAWRWNGRRPPTVSDARTTPSRR